MIKKGDWVKCPEYSGPEVDWEVRFTPGKMYEVIHMIREDWKSPSGPHFILRDDKGRLVPCSTTLDAFIGGEDWIICSFEKNLKEILKEEG